MILHNISKICRVIFRISLSYDSSYLLGLLDSIKLLHVGYQKPIATSGLALALLVLEL